MRFNSLIQLVAAFVSAFLFTACGMGIPPLPDGGVTDPLMGTACTPPGAIVACDFTCWSDAARGCTNDRPGDSRWLWTGCTRLPTGRDTCAIDAPMMADAGPVPTDTGPPDSGMCVPSPCTTVCGNLGVRLCTGGMPDVTCTPSDIALETCAAADAGPLPVDAGPPPVDAGPPDAGAPDSGPPDAGPVICGGCIDPLGLRACTTPCGNLGSQTCGECLAGGPCHIIDLPLETCSLDAGMSVMDSGVDAPMTVDAGSDAGPAPVDAGTDAPVAMVDAGTDAGPAPVDAGTDAPVAMVDAGSDAGPAPVDAGRDSGPAPVDAGTDAPVAMVDAGTDSGPAPVDAGTGVVLLGGPGLVVVQIGGSDSFLCPSGGIADIRLFDSAGTMHSSHRTRSLVLSSALFGPGNRINLTIYCQLDTVNDAWNGYTSPMVQGQTLNTRVSTTVFTEISVGGRDVRPGSFYCWDTSQPRTLMIERAQFPIVGPTDALPTSCYGTTGS